ncbi:hypothetical protein [Arthrobacter bambusae]|uniref:STAS domain-containing protein n=1 Tax=Arthrobacter bambusae TaxID=1338426 RepID=A0AAW8D6A4_9MICC|nr:hypothetical protein [Arthrobacter bambusae]MDP9903230.1 hypothetical protein [Arthrobacter bambusae]MDQ0128776.1 hypothetical protein [Arthrobacter bambusae]MDQ0180117.1 hypothetical protein [Arthrobacter bambusae]
MREKPSLVLVLIGTDPVALGRDDHKFVAGVLQIRQLDQQILDVTLDVDGKLAQRVVSGTRRALRQAVCFSLRGPNMLLNAIGQLSIPFAPVSSQREADEEANGFLIHRDSRSQLCCDPYKRRDLCCAC